ncbi:MAG: hypothetical protein ACI8UO_003902 [Verrucomicrobiales bacterium]|jgi:hypothetical protein
MKAIASLFALAILTFGTAQAELSREAGAIYLEDFMDPDDQVVLRVAHAAPVFYQLDGARRLGTLRPGHDAEVIAISNKAYLVRAKAEHVDVVGWVTPKAFQAHSGKDFVAALKELYKRQVLVNDLIAKRQVALGMTIPEVKLALGDPDRVNQTIEAEGRKDSLEFITYEKVLQPVTRYDQSGVPFRDYVYVKVETGKTTIDFKDEIVTGIHNTEGAPKLGAGVTIPVRPALIF